MVRRVWQTLGLGLITTLGCAPAPDSSGEAEPGATRAELSLETKLPPMARPVSTTSGTPWRSTATSRS